MKSFLIIGNGAREAIFATKLSIDSVVYAVMSHPNPTIIDLVSFTGGKFIVDDINDGNIIADFALKHNIDYVFVNSDNPLANGVIDVLLDKNIKAIGPSKSGARIEWDKVYSIDVVNKLVPQFCPKYKVINNKSEIDSAINYFAGKDIVVKPQGLTGGKGVKVMGEHLKDYKQVKEYIDLLLQDNTKILLCEKLQGFEFTIMAITDGKDVVFAPATYDYPYRFKNDQGPGTGGMGCFTSNSLTLPFMQQVDFDNCCMVIKSVINYFNKQNIHFNGVLNGGFFLTKDGIKFMEFNARFGDPEAVNVLSLLNSSFSKILENIYHKNLLECDIEFINKASVVKYLVSKEYPNKGKKVEFDFDVNNITKSGIDVYFSAAKRSDSKKDYETVSSSRVVALCCIAENEVDASNKINQIADDLVIKTGLDYRSDIADFNEIKRLQSSSFESKRLIN